MLPLINSKERNICLAAAGNGVGGVVGAKLPEEEDDTVCATELPS